jgi:hypothetical protein
VCVLAGEAQKYEDEELSAEEYISVFRDEDKSGKLVPRSRKCVSIHPFPH